MNEYTTEALIFFTESCNSLVDARKPGGCKLQHISTILLFWNVY